MSVFSADARPGHPYWWDDAPPSDLSDPPPETVDVAVIGAGYTGLSAAIAAHDAGASVAVIDAGLPGAGASTRNGGMLGAHPRLSWEALHDRFGAEVADGVFAEADPALNFVKALIETESIACDLRQTGRIQLAWTRDHFANQRRLAQRIREKSAIACDVIDRDALPDHISTDRYVGGLFFPSHCAIHPAKFHAGLLASVRKRNIPVAANMPVTRIDTDGNGVRVQTATAKLRAAKVLIATNGYTSDHFRWHASRVFPIPSFLIATEPIDRDRLSALAPGCRMMVETRARHSYFRLSPDGRRILFGGRASMVDIPPARAAQRLRKTMLEIWPSLSDVRMTHAWMGNTGFSFAHVPHVGNHGPVHYAMGFSGSGTVLAPYLGAKAAWRALGDTRGATAYTQTPLRRSWLMPGTKPHFLHAADLWYRQWVDRREDRVAQ